MGFSAEGANDSTGAGPTVATGAVDPSGMAAPAMATAMPNFAAPQMNNFGTNVADGYMAKQQQGHPIMSALLKALL